MGLDGARLRGCEKSLVDAPERGGKALHLTVASKPPEGWMSHAFIHGLHQDIKTGDKIAVTFWARTLSGGDNGRGLIKLELGQSENPYTGIINKFFNINQEWSLHSIDGVATFDLAADKGRFGFCLGYWQQVIEIANISVHKTAP